MSADPQEHDFLDAHGRAVHRFALDMANLGSSRLADALTAMLESGAWQEFKDGLGTYRFLPGEFDYFLSQQGVDREQVMLGVRDVTLKATLEEAMDERRTGTTEYRRPLQEARKANPNRPGRPIIPYGYSEREAKVLVDEGRLPQTGHRPPLGPAVRRFRVTGGQTTVSAAKQAPLVERLGRSAKRLSDEELEQLIATLRTELRQRRQR